MTDDSVFASLQQVSGATYTDASYNKDIIDVYMLRRARQKGIRLPTGGPPDEYKYLGAKVFQSSAGMSNNVTYIDVSSMYPSFLMTLNASPETIIGTREDLKQSEYTEDDCVWGWIDQRDVKHIKKGEPWQQYTNGKYKIVYDPETPDIKWTCDEAGGPQYQKLYFLSHDVQKGFLTECVEELIDLKNQYRGTSLYGSTKRVTNCFTPDTEVMTPNGVVNIRDLDVGDEVYSFNKDTEEVEVKPVTETWEYPDYEGEIVNIQTKDTDLSVTPNHRILCNSKKWAQEQYEFIEAGELIDKGQFYLPRDFEFDNSSSLSKIDISKYIDKNNYEVTENEIVYGGNGCYSVDRYISTEQVSRLIGWYVSEGCVMDESDYENDSNKKRMVITQSDVTGHRDSIVSLLENIGLNPHTTHEKNITVWCKPIAEFLESCGKYSHTKKLPEFVWSFSSDDKETLLNVLMKGDGDKTGYKYYTCSEKLKDQVLKLTLHLGYQPKYKKIEKDSGRDMYRVFLRESRNIVTNDVPERQHTDNGVYCVTVKDNHTLLAGRNGKFQFVGQSIYGVLGFANEDSSFRLFDWRIAEAITLCGRKMIEFSANYTLEKLAERGHDDAYVALGDTDGCGIALPSVSTRHEALTLIEDICESMNTEGYDQFFADEFGVEPQHHHGEIEVESFAPKVFIPSREPPHGSVGVKKRRIEWQTWDDDEGEKDDISITGLEAERSDVAPLTRQAQEAFAETQRVDDSTAREQLFPQLRSWDEQIENRNMALQRVCKRKGIGQSLHEYGSSSRKPAPIYRGAKYANKHIDGVTIQHGDKPSLIYLSQVTGDYPSTYSATTGEDGEVVDAVALPDVSSLPDGFRVNWDKHKNRALVEPMKPLLQTRFGDATWDAVIHQHSQEGLDAFSAD